MGLKSSLSWFTAIFAVVYGIIYQQSPVIRMAFMEPRTMTDNSACVTIPEAQACEKIVLHQKSGLLYLACSTPEARTKWAPFFLFMTEALPTTDYLAIYSHNTRTLKHLTLSGFTDPRGLHVHGLDVVPSSSDPDTLWVYVVNHRPQKDQSKNLVLGADEAIEVFKTTTGSDTLEYVRTFDDQSVIRTPNDVVGSADGEAFYFTNDFPSKFGKVDRFATFWLGKPYTSVGYCSVKDGCKIAIDGIIGANGIAKTNDDTIWVASGTDGYIRSYLRQADNSLVAGEEVKIGRLLDNLTIDKNGNMYGAILAGNVLATVPYLADPINKKCQTAAYNISLSTGPDAYYGKKYTVERIFEDDGSTISGVTTAAYDVEAKLLYLSGISALTTLVCPVA